MLGTFFLFQLDGKKFSRMTEMHMQRFGILHPILVHFRQHTYKKKSGFKFSL